MHADGKSTLASVSKCNSEKVNTLQNFWFMGTIVFEVAGGLANPSLVKVWVPKGLVNCEGKGLKDNSTQKIS